MLSGAAHAACVPEPCVSGSTHLPAAFLPSRSSAKSAAAESAYWAGQTARRAEARAATKDLALDKLEQLAKREGQVGSGGSEGGAEAGRRLPCPLPGAAGGEGAGASCKAHRRWLTSQGRAARSPVVTHRTTCHEVADRMPVGGWAAFLGLPSVDECAALCWRQVCAALGAGLDDTHL